MDVKEFRTGNLLNYTTAEGDILPSALDWQDFKWLEENKKGFELVHDYIQLTEQWLLDFGFRRQDFDHIYLFPKNDSFRLWGFRWDLQAWSFNTKGDGWDDITTPRIQYVHQLQNLYYSLTGEELIKK